MDAPSPRDFRERETPDGKSSYMHAKIQALMGNTASNSFGGLPPRSPAKFRGNMGVSSPAEMTGGMSGEKDAYGEEEEEEEEYYDEEEEQEVKEDSTGVEIQNL
jgi:hypothetical protein